MKTNHIILKLLQDFTQLQNNESLITSLIKLSKTALTFEVFLSD